MNSLQNCPQCNIEQENRHCCLNKDIGFTFISSLAIPSGNTVIIFGLSLFMVTSFKSRPAPLTSVKLIWIYTSVRKDMIWS